MLQYLYQLDYHMPVRETAVHNTTSLPPEVNDGLMSAEEKSLESDNQESTNPLASIPTDFELTFHSKVYTIAEKCWLNDLKEVVKRKFQAATSREWALDDFVCAAQEAYNGTLDTDRGLRDIVLQALCSRKGIMEKEAAQSLVEEQPALAYDMILYMPRQSRY